MQETSKESYVGMKEKKKDIRDIGIGSTSH